MAVERSIVIANSQSQIDQADEQVKQARAGYSPILSLQASFAQQDDSTNPINQDLSASSQSATSINLSQNLFQGFKDMSRVNQIKHLKVGYEWSKKMALERLYKDVAQAFYSILIFKSDIAMYKEQIISTKQRKSELNAARKSRRARDSDILTVDSLIANLDAAISRAEGQIVAYNEAFIYLTGVTTEVELINNLDLPSDFRNDETWLSSMESRSDVQQSKSIMRAAEDEIIVAKSGYYPRLDFGANYYFSRSGGFSEGVDWDAHLVLVFPFFSGGLTKAQVREATIEYKSKELNLKMVYELAQQNIKTTAGAVQADIDQLVKLQQSTNLSRRSFELITRDNRLGVATNTDVLISLQTWQESKRNLERARITSIYDYVRLLIESSQLESSLAALKKQNGDKK